MSRRIASRRHSAGAIVCALAHPPPRTWHRPAVGAAGSTVKLSFLVPNEEAEGDRHQGPDRVPDSARHADPRRLGRAEARMEVDGHDEAPRQADPTDDGTITDVVSEIDWVALTPGRRDEAGRVRRVHHRRRRPARRRGPSRLQGDADLLERHGRAVDRSGHRRRPRARAPDADPRAHRARRRRRHTPTTTPVSTGDATTVIATSTKDNSAHRARGHRDRARRGRARLRDRRVHAGSDARA